METKKVTKKNKVWIASWICFTIGIQLLLAGCTPLVIKKNLTGGPYPPSKDLPKVVEVVTSSLGLTYMGWIEVMGSKEGALKAAAKLGARVVELKETMIEDKIIEYDYYRDGGGVKQRPIGTSRKLRPGYTVYLYR